MEKTQMSKPKGSSGREDVSVKQLSGEKNISKRNSRKLVAKGKGRGTKRIEG